jgi:hypothetical protein
MKMEYGVCGVEELGTGYVVFKVAVLEVKVCGFCGFLLNLRHFFSFILDL